MEPTAHQEKSHAALSSVLWSAFLTVIKLWAGIVTGSLGIISEALHSGLDLMAAAMTFYAVKVASRPADESHPYGHEKVENLSALAETALLLVTCAWIVWEAVDRLFYNEAEITLTWWAFAVVAVSLLVDVNRSAMLRRIAKKHKSQALEADALHFTTDIWSSAVVLLGLFCIWLAHLVPAESAWHGLLERADAIAALFVAALVCSVAFGLAKRSIHALMDGGSSSLTRQVLDAMKKNAPDYPVKRIRLRDGGLAHLCRAGCGSACWNCTWMTPMMWRNPLEGIKHGAGSGRHRPYRTGAGESFQYGAGHDYPPAGLAPPCPHSRFLCRPRQTGPLLFHGCGNSGGLALGTRLPCGGGFRDSILHELKPEKVICRIEPDCRDMETGAIAEQVSPEEVRLKVNLILQQHRTIRKILKLDLTREANFPTLTCVCSVDASLTIRECHQIASQLENQIENALHHLGRVTVILKPSKQNRN